MNFIQNPSNPTTLHILIFIFSKSMALLVTSSWFLPSYNSLNSFEPFSKTTQPMGFGFELKITPTRDDDDDSSSNFELQLARGTASPFFWSNETNSMFILTARLTGFGREDIVITINGSGTRIEISWGQPVQKMEITRWIYKKETETRRFKKIFRIPDGVVLDEIKATYNDEESILTILMPKSVDGILGVGIEEVQEQEVSEAAFESQDSEDEEIPETTAEFETLETGRKTKLVEDNHGNEEEDAANEEVEGGNAKPKAFPKREYVAETLPKVIEKLKGDEMENIDEVSSKDYSESEHLEKDAIKTTEYEATNGEIKDPVVKSMEGIEVAEGTSQGTPNNQKEKGEFNAEAHNGNIATMINKQPDVKTQSQASIDREAQVLDRELLQPNRQTQAEPGKQETYKNVWEMKELETDKEPEDIESSYLQSPAHEHEEKGVDQQGKSFQIKDEIKETREESKSPQRETHEDSSKEAKQEKKQNSKQFQMRTPIIIAGSALLASLVIVAFNFVRSKRREKNMRG